MSAGAAAADIKMGKYNNWMGPERIVMNTVRLYDEFKGTLTPDIDVEGMKQAILEYNSIKASEEKNSCLNELAGLAAQEGILCCPRFFSMRSLLSVVL